MGTLEAKKIAAEKAIDFIESGMIVGLGTGSTVHFALLKLAELIKTGHLKNIIGIPTSVETELKAKSLGIPVGTLESYPVIDLTVDGADEVDKNLNLIKGGGGALLREKIVAQASRKFVIAVDENKLSDNLFEKFALPVEIIKFALAPVKSFLEGLGGEVSLRLKNSKPYLTDEDNFILDVKFHSAQDLFRLDSTLNRKAGIVEHGLFLEMEPKVVVGTLTNVKIL